MDNEETSNSSPDSATNSSHDSVTDSSLDTSSIEVIQPSTEGLEIRRPDNPPPRAPPQTPQSPRSNIAADISGLLTEDEDSDQVVPLTIYPSPLESQGRKEILSPTPNRENTIRSAIELTVDDLQPSEQGICDKCGEVDFQLGSHNDWNQPHRGLRTICVN